MPILKWFTAAASAGVLISAALTSPAMAQPKPVPASATAPRPSSHCVADRCVTAHARPKLAKQPTTASNLKRAAAGANTARHGLASPQASSPQLVNDNCSSGYTNPTRFVSCGDSIWEITNTETTDGVSTVVGEVDFEVLSSATFGLDVGIPDWRFDADVYTTYTYGTMAEGVSGAVSTNCGRNPQICETLDPSDGKAISLLPDGAVHLTWEQADNGNVNTIANSVDTLDAQIGTIFDLTTPFGEVESNDAPYASLWGRCDNIATTAPECVDEYGAVIVTFSALSTPKVSDVADHIYTAEATLPSHWGNPNTGDPLTLARDATVAARNRAIACPGIPPAGKSCDEYPMASTYQGAAFSAPGDWSTAIVQDTANDSQGATLRNSYQLYRMLDQDPFWVLAIRADGSASW